MASGNHSAGPKADKTIADEALRETAAQWHDLIVQGDDAAQMRTSFEAWLNESPAHRSAYSAVERAWTFAANKAHEPQILALRHETALRLTRHSSVFVQTRLRRAAVFACVVAGGLLGAVLLSNTDTNNTIPLADIRPVEGVLDFFRGGNAAGRLATEKGERLTARFEDGSQVTLNTETKIETKFSAAERLVILSRGQALFEVAKDKNRPFIVETQGRRFVAVGTAFDVRVDGERVQITMVEGTVRVERKQRLRAAENAQPKESTTLLRAGEQLIVDDKQLDRVRVANAERVTSWRLGQVIFEDTRLSDAVAELNRYSQSRIELTDPKLAELRISGAFATGRPTIFVEALTTYFPIRADQTDDETVVLTSRD